MLVLPMKNIVNIVLLFPRGFWFMSPLSFVLFISIYLFQGVVVRDPSAPFLLLKKKIR